MPLTFGARHHVAKCTVCCKGTRQGWLREAVGTESLLARNACTPICGDAGSCTPHQPQLLVVSKSKKGAFERAKYMYTCQRTVRASRSNPRERWCIHSQIAFTSHLQMDGTRAHILMCMCSHASTSRSAHVLIVHVFTCRVPEVAAMHALLPMHAQFPWFLQRRK